MTGLVANKLTVRDVACWCIHLCSTAVFSACLHLFYDQELLRTGLVANKRMVNLQPCSTVLAHDFISFFVCCVVLPAGLF
jgi:hypothetical protein